jgi:hypothetical protein
MWVGSQEPKGLVRSGHLPPLARGARSATLPSLAAASCIADSWMGIVGERGPSQLPTSMPHGDRGPPTSPDRSDVQQAVQTVRSRGRRAAGEPADAAKVAEQRPVGPTPRAVPAALTAAGTTGRTVTAVSAPRRAISASRRSTVLRRTRAAVGQVAVDGEVHKRRVRRGGGIAVAPVVDPVAPRPRSLSTGRSGTVPSPRGS